jgi:glycosyltransferase involved in cell wall biosynthesis
MKLLVIVHQYYPNIGGVESVVKSIVDRLPRYKKLINGVIVLTGEKNIQEMIIEDVNDFVRIYRWPVLAWNNAYFIPKDLYKLYDIVHQIVMTNDIKVVHVHCAHAIFPVVLGLYIKRKFRDKVKLIVSMHYHASGHSFVRVFLWKFWRFYVNMLVNLADVLHSVSIYESELIKRDYPISNNKLVIIPNGVDEKVFNYRWRGQESNYILYAGRIEKYKNIEKAFIILKALNKYVKDFKLKIIGNGPYLVKLKKIASDMGLFNHVIFGNYTSKERYYETIANAYSVVNLSEHEAFSIFVAEALAIGTPAIVSHNIAKIYLEPFSFEGVCIYSVLHKVLDILNLKLLVPSRNIHIFTWNDVVDMLVSKIYRS